MCHCFCCCGYVIRKANWHTLSGFFPLFSCGSSLAMVKTDVKSAFWRVSFFRPDLSLFFLFLYLCHLPTTCYSWVLFLKQKVVHCVLSFWHQSLVMPRSYMLIPLNFLSDRTRCDFVLPLHTNNGISPNQKQHELALRPCSHYIG